MQSSENISVSLEEYHRKISQTIHDEFEKVNERFDSQKESTINADAIKIELLNVEEHIRTELRDYNNLQHIIEQKTNEAVEKVNAKLKTIGWCVSFVVALGAFPAVCWFRDFVTDKVTEKYVSENLQAIIDTKVPEMIIGRVTPIEKEIRRDFSQIVSNEVEKIKVKEKELETKIAIAGCYLDVMMKINDLENGSRVAYDALRRFSSLPNPLAKVAKKSILYVQEKYQRDKNKPFRMVQGTSGWTSFMSSQKLSEIVKEDKSKNVIDIIRQMADTKQTQYVATLCYAVEHSKSLDTVYEAIWALDLILKKKFSALGVDEVLEWWNKNKADKKFYIRGEIK